MIRPAIAFFLGITAALFLYAIGIGLRAPLVAAWSMAIGGGALCVWLHGVRPIVHLDPSAISRPLATLSAIATLLALVQLGRLTAFIADDSRADLSVLPASAWEVHHNCATSYYVAAAASFHSTDFYADSLYTARDDDPTKVRKPLKLGSFNIDVYEYPPPFLLLARTILRVAPSFPAFRALWFGLSGFFLLGVMLWVLRGFAPVMATRAILWLPLLWAAPTTVSTLQKENVQPLIIAAAILAMVLFERRRFALGGFVLAFATVSKLYPGMLILYLLACRRWRAAAWTFAFALVFTLAIGLELGRGAYDAFARHLPGLLSGEAFPAFRNPMPTANNVSIPGLVFKLRLFGVPGIGFDTMRIVGWIYTLAAVGITWWLARQPRREDEKPLAWLAILIVATLRSPFLPSIYGVFPATWMLCLLASRLEPTARNVLAIGFGWLLLAFYWPPDWRLDPRWLALYIGLVQAFMIGLVIWWWRRGSALGPSIHSTA